MSFSGRPAGSILNVMRGVFRRPFPAVATGSFGIAVGTAIAAFNLRAGHPRYMLVAVIIFVAGLNFAGIFPQDRDLDERDSKTWQRIAPFLVFLPLGLLFAELALPLPDPAATAVIGLVFAMFVAGNAWFMSHGRPMTDALIEEQLAKAEGNATGQLGLMASKPRFWGKAARVTVLGAGCTVAGLIAVGMYFTVRDATEPRRPARWLELPVHYCTDTGLEGYVDDDTFIESAALAFERWGVPAVHDGACPSFVENDDGVSAIGWRPLHTEHDGGTYRIASCKYFCSGDEAHDIGESDIYLTPFIEEEFADRECFDALMLHEVGHFLGLNHNDGYGIMGDGAYCSSEFSSADLAALFDRYGEQARPQYATLTGSQ